MDTVSPLIGPLPENAAAGEDDDMNNFPNFTIVGEPDESRGEATFRYTGQFSALSCVFLSLFGFF